MLSQVALFAFICASFSLEEASGHGMLLEPPNRSSLWRFDPTAPANYEDNQNFCGGMSANRFNGKSLGANVCGDRFDTPHPQDNENTGRYGTGRVVQTYAPGSIIEVEVNLTSNHKGTFTYSLCVLGDPNAPESGEDCFQALTLGDGSPEYHVAPLEKVIKHTVKLPDGVQCSRCVLRWNYRAGNTWGDCGDGTFASGCGPQETFRSCSDIAIL